MFEKHKTSRFKRGEEDSRIRGVLLAAELTVAVGRVDDLPGVTVDPRWKRLKKKNQCK